MRAGWAGEQRASDRGDWRTRSYRRGKGRLEGERPLRRRVRLPSRAALIETTPADGAGGPPQSL